MRAASRCCVVAIVVASCANPPHRSPDATAPIRALSREALLPTMSVDQVFEIAGRRVPGTIVRPRLSGRYPAIVLLAGSGPTDRDWGAPSLATNNGSGRLLAAELASRGAVVVRYDKAGAGGNAGP